MRPVYKQPMPNQRKPGQTFIGCQIDEALLALLDKARGRRGRSLFLREAIAEKLGESGYKIAEDLIYPPDRAANSANVSGTKNKVSQKNFTLPSHVPRVKDAKYPKPKRGGAKKKPPEK